MSKKLAAEIPRFAVTPAEAAASVGLGPDAFDQYVRPHLKTIRIGRKTLIPTADLERWVAENAEPSIAEKVNGR